MLHPLPELFSLAERQVMQLCTLSTHTQPHPHIQLPEPKLLQLLQENKLAPLIVWKKEHGLLPEHPSLPLSQTAWKLLKQIHQKSWVQHQLRQQALLQLLSAFKSNHIQLILYKGASYCHRLFPEPHLRPMADIDIIIRRPQTPLATRLLLELGYTDMNNEHPSERLFIHKQHQLHLDLHTHVLRPYFSRIQEKSLFRAVTPSPLGYSLFPETWEFLLHIYHQSKHLAAPPAISLLSFVELRELFLRVQNDWSEITALTQEWKMERILGVGLWMLHHAYKDLVHKDLLCAYPCPPHLKALLSLTKHPWHHKNIGPLKKNAQRWLQNLTLLSLIGHPADQLSYAKMRLLSRIKRGLRNQH